MKIRDLKNGMKEVNVEGVITSKSETRSFISRRTGRRLYVAEATLKDDTGEITLVLWNRQINEYNPGDRVRITNGYVNEFRGNLQLNIGRMGKIEKI